MSENNFKNLLYKFLDSKLTEDEKISFVECLNQDPKLEILQKELSEIRRKIKSLGKQEFSDRFESELLRKSNQHFLINTEKVFILDIISAVFKKVCLSATLILVLISLYNVNAGNISLFKNIFSKSMPDMEYVFDPTSKTNLVNLK